MSSQYLSDGRRRSSMTHATHSQVCDCGRRVFGNGGWSSHARACLVYRQTHGVFLGDADQSDWMNGLVEDGFRDFKDRWAILDSARRHAADAGRKQMEREDVAWAINAWKSEPAPQDGAR